MASRILTITIGSDVIKICDLALNSQKGVQVYTACQCGTPTGAVEDGALLDTSILAKAIKDTIEENKIETKDAIFCVQSSKIANKEVITPDLKDAKLAQFIQTNATDYFPVNIEEYIITSSEIETVSDENGKSKRVMVAAAPSAIIEPYYDLAELLQVKVIAVDYTGNATLQFVKNQVDELTNVFIQVSEDSTFVTIISKNVLQFMRTAPYGKATIANAIMEKRDINYQEALVAMSDARNALKDNFNEGDYVTDSLKYLVNNIKRVMDYYSQKNPEVPIDKAYILIEGAHVYGIEELLSNELNIEVEPFDAIKAVAPAYGIGTPVDMTLFIPCVGTAFSPVNFASRLQVTKQRRANASKYYKIGIIAALALAAVLVLAGLIPYLSSKSEKEDLEADIASMKQYENVANDFYDAKDKYSDANAFDIMTANNNDYIGYLVEYLEENQPSDISITALSSDSGSVSLTLTAASKNSIAELIQKFEESGFITGTYVPSITESIDANGTITASCSLSCYFTDPTPYMSDVDVDDEDAGTEEGVEDDTTETEESEEE